MGFSILITSGSKGQSVNSAKRVKQIQKHTRNVQLTYHVRTMYRERLSHRRGVIAFRINYDIAEQFYLGTIFGELFNVTEKVQRTLGRVHIQMAPLILSLIFIC